jgi:hypothetical protein
LRQPDTVDYRLKYRFTPCYTTLLDEAVPVALFLARSVQSLLRKETNWVPAPKGKFSLYIRAYWAEKAILDGTWMPPNVVKVK